MAPLFDNNIPLNMWIHLQLSALNESTDIITLGISDEKTVWSNHLENVFIFTLDTRKAHTPKWWHWHGPCLEWAALVINVLDMGHDYSTVDILVFVPQSHVLTEMNLLQYVQWYETSSWRGESRSNSWSRTRHQTAHNYCTFLSEREENHPILNQREAWCRQHGSTVCKMQAVVSSLMKKTKQFDRQHICGFFTASNFSSERQKPFMLMKNPNLNYSHHWLPLYM